MDRATRHPFGSCSPAASGRGQSEAWTVKKSEETGGKGASTATERARSAIERSREALNEKRKTGLRSLKGQTVGRDSASGRSVLVSGDDAPGRNAGGRFREDKYSRIPSKGGRRDETRRSGADADADG